MEFNDWQPSNILAILITFVVSKFDKSMFPNKLQPENIEPIFSTDEESKWDKSIDTTFAILLSFSWAKNFSILVTGEVKCISNVVPANIFNSVLSVTVEPS